MNIVSETVYTLRLEGFDTNFFVMYPQFESSLSRQDDTIFSFHFYSEEYKMKFLKALHTYGMYYCPRAWIYFGENRGYTIQKNFAITPFSIPDFQEPPYNDCYEEIDLYKVGEPF